MENHANLSTKKEVPKKPKWLKKLEEESWQAELIISGLAIYGALNFPYYISELIDWSICFFQAKDYFLIFTFFTYLTCASTFLIICFIAHFILRAIWIGMLGLNYVFPKGINYDFEQYSPFFMKKIQEQFPNNHQDIITLEKTCSIMFGIATTVMIVLITFNINILVLFGIKHLLEGFISNQILSFFGNFLLVFILAVSFLMFTLNLKRFHTNEQVQSWYFKISQVFSKAMYHIFYYPITKITYLFVTNYSIKGFLFIMCIIFGMMGVASVIQFKNSNILYLARDSRLYDLHSRTDYVMPKHYEENLMDGDQIFSAVIPSEKISGDLLKVFIPVFSNESVVIDSLCGEFESTEDRAGDKYRKERRKHQKNCYEKYHRLYVNDSLYTSELLSHKHPYLGETGVLTYLPTNKFNVGKNILRIEKIKSENKIHRTINITFWFSEY